MSKRELRAEQVVMPVLILSAMSAGLLTARNFATGSADYWFLNWNLVLAWLPLVFAWSFIRITHTRRWKNWQPLILVALWALFLPNSFYLVTDFVHLAPSGDVSLMYDIIMLMSFAATGIIVGLLSAYLLHEQLQRKFGLRTTQYILGTVFLLSSYAMYMGRNLGHNSWDIILNPFGILLDTTDRIVYPGQHIETYTTTLLFFVFICGCYFAFYKTIQLFRAE